ncbi:MAG TPA: ATP-binding cassette domain-containing protein, partial [Acidimicrobiia bacterium]|nr:ATP-binding cassette domain-containing protein [Acidimicrobiia bacterium]
MLRLQQVRAGYGRTEVLHGVDIVVPPGSAVALLGANGAGQSTLLRTAAGMNRATSGEIRLGGERIDHLSDHARTRAGLCLVPDGHA